MSDMETFTPEPTHYALTFDDLPAKGIEIEVRAGTVRERLAFDRMRFATTADLDAVMKREEDVLKTLAARLVSWNLPADLGYEALLDLDDPIINQVVAAWIGIITKGSDDLGKDSTPGPDPREASLPMESL
jgi:hypothetical protein